MKPEERKNDTGNVAGDRLKSFLERIEKLNEEIAGLNDHKKDLMAEIKGCGFCTKTVRKLIRLRKLPTEKRREEEEMEQLYRAAIGLE